MSTNHRNYWSKWLFLITFIAASFGGLKTPATPLDGVGEKVELTVAQASANLCRKVNTAKGLAVRSRPDTNATRIGGVDNNQQVTLAAGGRTILSPDGRLWVEIVSPINGYVALGYPNSENNLIRCDRPVANSSENSGTNSSSEITKTSLCRRIVADVAPQGLAIHQQPSRVSPFAGALPPGGRVILVPNYQLIPDREGEPRNWVEIASPIAGFIAADKLMTCDDVGRIPENAPISATPTAATSNFTTDSTSTSTPTEKNPQLCRRVEPRVAPNGLAIRANASLSATYLGGVEAGGNVYLVPNYREIPDPNDSNRKWLQITAPIPGFIAAGNLVMCR